MKNRAFAIFILTHGRPDDVITINTLRRNGYTGDVFLIVDDEDESVGRYRELYGDKVIQFCKKDAAAITDEADTLSDRRSIVYARNVCYSIASDLGLTHFAQFDDDYSEFIHRFDDMGRYYSAGLRIKNLDKVFSAMMDFLDSTPLKTVALAQGGDFIGGASGGDPSSVPKRKAMNSFFCRTDRPIKFFGRFNDDVNAYVVLGGRGDLFMTIMLASLNQKPTQSVDGGATELYKRFGTYVKSFYTIMMAPAAVKIRVMGSVNKRLHHNVNRNKAVPKIIRESNRKTR